MLRKAAEKFGVQYAMELTSHTSALTSGASFSQGTKFTALIEFGLFVDSTILDSIFPVKFCKSP